MKGPVHDAAERSLPACPVCGAWRGDPCRGPRWTARRPHKAREAVAAQEQEVVERKEARRG